MTEPSCYAWCSILFRLHLCGEHAGAKPGQLWLAVAMCSKWRHGAPTPSWAAKEVLQIGLITGLYLHNHVAMLPIKPEEMSDNIKHNAYTYDV